MKIVILMLGLCLGALAHGADRKVGNVIVVERAITNIYSSCIAEVLGDTTKPAAFFSCVIPVTQQSYEVLLSKDRFYHHSAEKCSVDSEFAGGKMLITFGGSREPISFEAAKVCLANVVAQEKEPAVFIQTVEIR